MKIVYPSNCREVHEGLGQDELIRRLKALAQTFQTLSQDEGKYKELIPLAHHLAEDFFLKHSSKDAQLLVACCIADILRIFAPEAPYIDHEEIKSVFYFLIRQLHGLRDPKDPAFKRYFYLLENLAFVKSFNMCFELPDDSQQVFCELFRTFFSIINDEHSHKVRNYMLEVMLPLIMESDQISDELLNTVMKNIIEESKVSRNTFLLAKELVMKTSNVLQPFLQAFFNRELLLDSRSGDHAKKLIISQRLYDLIYALNTICPEMLASVVPQLEYKLRSGVESDRLGAVSLLARMFSEKNSNLARDHRQLWQTFLGRFNDIKPAIRIKCVQYSMHFLMNHPELREDLIEVLKARQHDTDENVRYEVVTAIVSTARRDFEIVAESDALLSFVRERTLDKKFKIRREAMTGLAFVYKRRTVQEGGIIPHGNDRLSWIKNKILYGYYMTSLDDRLVVERLLNTTLVPYQMPVENRMKMLLSLVATVDEKAEKAFAEIMKNRSHVRKLVFNLLQVYDTASDDSVRRENELRLHVITVSKSLPDEIKAREFLIRFVHHMTDDSALLENMRTIADPNVTCKECADSVNAALKKLGQPIMTNLYYNTVKLLLERASSVLVDAEAIKVLLGYILEMLRGGGPGSSIEDLSVDPGISSVKGLKLLHLLATTQPQNFMNPSSLAMLFECIEAVSSGDTEEVHSWVLSIFSVLGRSVPIVRVCPDVFARLFEFSLINIKHGTAKVAKHSIRAILANYDGDEVIDRQLENTIEVIRESLDIENEFCRTALSAIGHVALLAPQRFPLLIRNIISKKVVKELLMNQKKPPLSTSDPWCAEEELPEETRCKLEGLKLIGRWLVGLKVEKIMAKKTFRMLSAFIVNNGDLNLNKDYKLSEAEKSWLRLGAGCCMLKICQQKGVGDEFNAEQFYNLSRLVADPVLEVREIFLQKLHKGLSAGIPNNCLPLDFMGFYAMCGLESNRTLRSMAKQHMLLNVQKRRDYIKTLILHGGDRAKEQLPHVLPDFVLVFGVPVLAHSQSFSDANDVDQLMQMRNCLWFILEPVVAKNENFCFTFLKNLVDAMKVRVDALDPTNDETNHKLWALSDLALGLIVSKTSNYETKEYLTEPRTPEIYFRLPTRPLDSNVTKSYLPPEVQAMALRKPTVVGKVLPERDDALEPGVRSEKLGSARGSQAVLRTLRDEPTLDSEDDQPLVKKTTTIRQKASRRVLPRGGSSKDTATDESDDEPLPRPSPTRTYARDPVYRVEEREIMLDELGGSASPTHPSSDIENEDADEALIESQESENDDTAEDSSRPLRTTRAGKAPGASKQTKTGIKRGAKTVVEQGVSNGKKMKTEPVKGTRSSRSRKQNEVSEEEEENEVEEEEAEQEEVEAEEALVKSPGLAPRAVAVYAVEIEDVPKKTFPLSFKLRNV